MKIIKPTYRIYPQYETTEEDLLKHIEYCGRICYQSRNKITEESAKQFVQKVIKRKHFSVLEMANIVLAVWSPYMYAITSPYIKKSIDLEDKNIVYISGSPRAFIEAILGNKILPEGRNNLLVTLSKAYPTFFTMPSKRGSFFPRWRVLTKEEIKELPWEIQRIHCKIAVEFTINRATSHQLVRHRPPSYLQESQRYCRYDEDVTFIEPMFLKTTKEKAIWTEAMQYAENKYKELLSLSVSPQQARLVLPNSTATSIICYASIEQWEHMFKQRCSSACDPNMYTIMRALQKDFIKYLCENFQYKEEENE